MILLFQGWSLKTRFIGVLLAFFLVFCFYSLFHSTPWLLVQLKQYSPDHGLPDQLFTYTPDQLHAILGAWGLVGRDFYRAVLFPVDLAFPFVYTGFFVLTVLYLLKKINPRRAGLYLLPLVALAGGAFDLLENLGVFGLSLLYPDRFDPLAWLSAVCTGGKWVCLGANLTLVVALAAWHWGQRWKVLLTPRG